MKSGKAKGIGFIMLAAMCFACMSMFVRLAGDLPTMEKAVFRNAVAMVIALVILLRDHTKLSVPRESRKFVWLRVICGTIGLVCNFYAIGKINLADANMLNKLSPFFVLIFSALFLQEKMKLSQILLIVGAFCGSLLIIKPSAGNLLLVPSLLGALGGVAAGAAYAFARGATTHGAPKTVVVLAFSAFSTISLLPLALARFVMPSAQQLICLVLCGVCGAGGQFAITSAYTCAPASEISVYDYSQVIFSAVLGFFVFDQKPDVLSVCGYVIIISLAVLNSYWNNRRGHSKA